MRLPLYHHFQSLASTNTLALAMAAQGAEHGTVFHADSQSGGRGRGTRKFISPLGGLYFSLILRPSLDSGLLPLITLAAGVGLCRGIRKTTGVEAKLKWPNDLYLEDKKLAGILAESGPVRKGGKVEFAVIGAGVNINTDPEQFPPHLYGKIISLSTIAASSVNADDLLPPLVDELLSAVQQIQAGTSDRDDLLACWRSLDYLLGRSLAYVCQGKSRPAVGAGLADDGRYGIIDRQGRQHQVTAGDLNPLIPIF